MNDFISVIIPAYNAVDYLADAIDSVLAQTYKNYEIIVIDDCSSDDTKRVIKAFIARNHSIKYMKHAVNKGPSASRNTGIAEAKGKFIAFLDADDLWIPEKLELQYERFNENPRLGVVFTGFTVLDLNKRIRREYRAPQMVSHREFVEKLLVKNIITGSSSSVMIKKECFERVGIFDTGLRYAEDWDMWLRIALEYQFGTVEKPCVFIKEHSKNASRNVERMITGASRVFLKNAPAYEKLFSKKQLKLIRRKALSIIYLGAAQAIRDDPNERKQLLRYLGKSIVCYPFKAFEKDDKYILIIKSMLPNPLRDQLHKVKMFILSLLYAKGDPRLEPDHEDF